MNIDNSSNAVDYKNIDFTPGTSLFPRKNKTRKSSTIHKNSRSKKPFFSSSENFMLQKYFNDVGQEYVFNSKQELKFSIKIKLFESFHKRISLKQNYIKNTESKNIDSFSISKSYNKLHTLETLSLITKNNINRFKAQFAGANLRLVISLSKNFSNRGLPYCDIIQEGNIGLLKAIDRFDPHMGGLQIFNLCIMVDSSKY